MFVFVFSNIPLFKTGQMYLNFLSAQSGFKICAKRFVFQLLNHLNRNRNGQLFLYEDKVSTVLTFLFLLLG